MSKKPDSDTRHDTRNDVFELLEGREMSRVVHSEAMHATLGEDANAAAELREQLGEHGENESAARARARLSRSVTALRATVRHSAVELVAALRGTGSCAAACLRAEAKRLRAPSLPSSAVAQA